MPAAENQVCSSCCFLQVERERAEVGGVSCVFSRWHFLVCVHTLLEFGEGKFYFKKDEYKSIRFVQDETYRAPGQVTSSGGTAGPFQPAHARLSSLNIDEFTSNRTLSALKLFDKCDPLLFMMPPA